jgi:hypothetical protein
VLANFSWNRTLQALMTRYQAATSVRHLPAAADVFARRAN